MGMDCGSKTKDVGKRKRRWQTACISETASMLTKCGDM